MKNNFKVGETVMVYKKVLGDMSVWIPSMNKYINKTVYIKRLSTIGNQKLVLCYNHDISKEEYYFPLESLRKLRKEKFKRILDEK